MIYDVFSQPRQAMVMVFFGLAAGLGSRGGGGARPGAGRSGRGRRRAQGLAHRAP